MAIMASGVLYSIYFNCHCAFDYRSFTQVELVEKKWVIPNFFIAILATYGAGSLANILTGKMWTLISKKPIHVSHWVTQDWIEQLLAGFVA